MADEAATSAPAVAPAPRAPAPRAPKAVPAAAPKAAAPKAPRKPRRKTRKVVRRKKKVAAGTLAEKIELLGALIKLAGKLG